MNIFGQSSDRKGWPVGFGSGWALSITVIRDCFDK